MINRIETLIKKIVNKGSDNRKKKFRILSGDGKTFNGSGRKGNTAKKNRVEDEKVETLSGIKCLIYIVIDVSRDPRWGRTYETYGEDQYLISQMGIHYVRGMQKQGVSCIAKHFLGYAETQAGLNTATTRLNDRELYEVFATPFEAADKEAGLDAMMAIMPDDPLRKVFK